MTDSTELFLGEWARALDERHRLSLPPEWAERLAGDAADCTFAKERPGCLSLWNTGRWHSWLDRGVDLLQSKLRADRLTSEVDQVQRLGRLLSTRHRTVPIAGRARVAIPESFRDFLGVEPGGDVLVVGAAVCVEVWRPESWSAHIGAEMPGFRELFEKLTQ